jgi:hypothetical protein
MPFFLGLIWNTNLQSKLDLLPLIDPQVLGKYGVQPTKPHELVLVLTDSREIHGLQKLKPDGERSCRAAEERKYEKGKEVFDHLKDASLEFRILCGQ